MDIIKKKPIRMLSLDDLYELARNGYIITKHNDTIIIGRKVN